MDVPVTDDARSESAESGESHGFRKVLSWRDGLAVGMCMPAGAIASYGYWENSLGTWGVIALIAGSTLIAVLQAVIVAELAGMFPEKPGGIAMFAHEGWKRYTNLAGPVSATGYWFSWSVVLALNGVVIGSLLQAQFFPGATWGGQTHIGPLTLTVGFPQVVATGVIFVVWLLNVFGARVLAVSSWILGSILVIPLVFFIVGPFVSGHWSSQGLHYHVTTTGKTGTSLTLLIVWLYLMGWSTYGLELLATFTPEFREPQRDFPRALRWCTIVSAASFLLMPLATGGATGDTHIAGAGAPGPFYKAVTDHIFSGAGGIVIVLLCIALLLVMNAATGDGGRVLYGMSRDGLTVKWLRHLNKHNVPSRGMTVDLVVNIFLVYFISNPVGIYAVANLGYFVVLFFTLTGFLLLRRDRPAWPRPIRLGKPWLGIAAILAVVTLVLMCVGAWRTDLTGYGTKTQLAIAVGVLLFSIVLWVFRQRVQERRALKWRDPRVERPADVGHRAGSDRRSAAIEDVV
jgi:amino acid transporter